MPVLRATEQKLGDALEQPTGPDIGVQCHHIECSSQFKFAIRSGFTVAFADPRFEFFSRGVPEIVAGRGLLKWPGL